MDNDEHEVRVSHGMHKNGLLLDHLIPRGDDLQIASVNCWRQSTILVELTLYTETMYHPPSTSASSPMSNSSK